MRYTRADVFLVRHSPSAARAVRGRHAEAPHVADHDVRRVPARRRGQQQQQIDVRIETAHSRSRFRAQRDKNAAVDIMSIYEALADEEKKERPIRRRRRDEARGEPPAV